jgi:predicted XRE-type DNA-binding protein
MLWPDHTGLPLKSRCSKWLSKDDERITRRDMGHRKDSHGVLPSSGNVFADLGLPNAEERQTKLRLAFAINKIIAERRLSQTRAAQCLEVSQPKVSALRNYELAGFSVERLMNFLTSLDRDVEILIRPKPKGRRSARILVTAA